MIEDDGMLKIADEDETQMITTLAGSIFEGMRNANVRPDLALAALTINITTLAATLDIDVPELISSIERHCERNAGQLVMARETSPFVKNKRSAN